jgi:AmmeMemoRadiSam system protein B
MFYPGTPQTLASAVSAYLAEGATEPGAAVPAPKAVIVPHAGYVYSAPVAARAYRRIAAGRRTVRRVVMLGPVHRVPVRGLAAPSARAFATPLGAVAVDVSTVERALELPQVRVSEPAHALEHSLEVQLPFLQTVLGEFAIVPLAVGDATEEEVAEVIERLWGGPETLIVVSSDLSHYHPYSVAQTIDRTTAAAILALDTSRRRSTGSRCAPAATASSRSSSTCAIRATPRATSLASWATRPSPSRKRKSDRRSHA